MLRRALSEAIAQRPSHLPIFPVQSVLPHPHRFVTLPGVRTREELATVHRLCHDSLPKIDKEAVHSDASRRLAEVVRELDAAVVRVRCSTGWFVVCFVPLPICCLCVWFLILHVAGLV